MKGGTIYALADPVTQRKTFRHTSESRAKIGDSLRLAYAEGRRRQTT